MGFAEALTEWLSFLDGLGIDAAANLNPPARSDQIEEVESAIDFSLPDDLKQLYLRADGQKDPDAESEHIGVVAPFFGWNVFVSLDDALDDYRVWKNIYDEAGADFDEAYSWVESREPDKVAARYWQPGWFPFAIDPGGNAFAVDLTPLPGGKYGQIIVIGSDEDVRRVLAPSLAEFMQAAAKLTPDIERDGNFLAFEMEVET